MKHGAKHTLIRGRDFDCNTKSMSIYLYTKAKRLGYKVQVYEPKEGQLVIAVRSAKKGKRSA